MCGIIGIASRHPVANRDVLTEGRDSMVHRGPDDAGVWWAEDRRVGFAHRRLAIIDLSPGGHQPMQDEGGELCIVLNGEIYNFIDLRRELMCRGHVFRSRSDTEVLVAAYREWGTDCLAKLNGMFAFALYDRRYQRIFLARDRAGEKPLFYVMRKDGLRFASELKGLMADPELARHIDPDALDCYLTMGFVPGERCILQGVNKLPPAHALVFDLDSGQSRAWRYWQTPEPLSVLGHQTDERGLLDEVEALLEDAVRGQMVADVPVGVLLSGGVDSSLVTAMAARARPKVKTFTVRFPGYGPYDETEHARLIARHFDTEHVELEAAESSVELLPFLARQFDEPIVDSSMIPTFLVSQLVRQHCTVVLGGDGGDELFGGYPHYDRLLWLWKQLQRIPGPLRAFAAQAADRLLPIGFKGRNWLGSVGAELERGLPLIASFFEGKTRKQLMARAHPWRLVGEDTWNLRIPLSKDLLERVTRMDFENYLPEDILAKVDRASMSCSLEVRAPMLDHRIIEFAFGRVPSSLKATSTDRKILLKRLCSRILPPAFDMRRKQGFSIPLHDWLKKGPWHDYFEDVLIGSEGGLFDKQCIRRMLAGQRKGRNNSERLFALTLFELWRREYDASLA